MAVEAFRGAKRIGAELCAVALAGACVGAASTFGVLPAACSLLFLAGASLFALWKKLYGFAVMAGVVLLACVFVEPSPADVLLAGVVPLGMLSGAFRPQAPGKATAPLVLLGLYFLASLPGVAVAVDLAAATRFFLITLYLFILAFFVCTYATQANIQGLLRAYVLAAFLSLGAGLLGLLGFFPDLLMMDPYRVKGLFKDPNVFGPFFVPAVLLLLDDRKRKRVLPGPAALHWAGAALLSLGVVFSYSRAAWINLAAGAVLYGMFNLRGLQAGRVLRAALTCAVALGVAAGLLLSPALRDTGIAAFLGERAQLQGYDQERFGTQHGGLALIAQHPLGIGPGQFEKEIAGVTGMELSSHSLFIRTASESGIPGFLLFFGAVGCVIVMLWKERRKNPPSAALQAPSPAVLISILAGLLINSIVVDTLHWRHLWFFLGIALFYIRDVRAKAVCHG